MTRRWTITKERLQALAERYPFNQIAEMEDVDPRTVTTTARKYGIAQKFGNNYGDERELEAVQILTAQGWAIKQIADAIGRSQCFVADRVDHDAYNTLRKEAHRSYRHDWPRPNIYDFAALAGVQFEDVPESISARECRGAPINGIRLAASVRADNLTYSRTAADLCTDQ